MYRIHHNLKIRGYFPALHAKDEHKSSTRSATHNLLDIPLTKTNMYGKNSIKNHCIRDWNNFKKDLPDIPDSELSLSKRSQSSLKKNTLVNTELYHHYLSGVI